MPIPPPFYKWNDRDVATLKQNPPLKEYQIKTASSYIVALCLICLPELWFQYQSAWVHYSSWLIHASLSNQSPATLIQNKILYTNWLADSDWYNTRSIFLQSPYVFSSSRAECHVLFENRLISDDSNYLCLCVSTWADQQFADHFDTQQNIRQMRESRTIVYTICDTFILYMSIICAKTQHADPANSKHP